MTSEELAQLFHETYERLAPDFGYKTREASAKPWADVPEQNKSLMVAVASEVLQKLQGSEGIEATVFQALGEASMCWNPRPAGVFDSINAKRIGEELLQAINSR